MQRFLELGGHADTVYKEDYGWDVGPDWLFTKPQQVRSIGAANASPVGLTAQSASHPLASVRG